MIFGYIRVSTSEQTVESQKNLISRYLVDKRLHIDEWVEVEVSSRKSLQQRGITSLLEKLSKGDILIVSELSRLGRSIKEVLQIIETLLEEKQCRLVMVKQNLDVDPTNRKDMTNKILLTIFSMMAELERDFISERTKEGLKARKARGIILGKPKGVIQSSIYDKDQEKIFHLHRLGVPVQTIIDTHLKYGKYLSLKQYISKRYKP